MRRSDGCCAVSCCKQGIAVRRWSRFRYPQINSAGLAEAGKAQLRLIVSRSRCATLFS